MEKCNPENSHNDENAEAMKMTKQCRNIKDVDTSCLFYFRAVRNDAQ